MQANGEVERQNRLLFNRKVRGKISDLRNDYVRSTSSRFEQRAKTRDYADTQRRASHSSVEISDEVLVQQDKTNKLSTPFYPTPFKVVSKKGNSPMVGNPTGKQYSRNTSHVKQYVNDPTPQQEPYVSTIPASLPTELRRAGYRTAGQ